MLVQILKIEARKGLFEKNKRQVLSSWDISAISLIMPTMHAAGNLCQKIDH